jgi:hypothetical protein
MDLDAPGSLPAEGGASRVEQWLLISKQQHTRADDGYAGTHVLYQDVVIPAAPADTASLDDLIGWN